MNAAHGKSVQVPYSRAVLREDHEQLTRADMIFAASEPADAKTFFQDSSTEEPRSELRHGRGFVVCAGAV